MAEKIKATLTYKGKSVDMDDEIATKAIMTDMIKNTIGEKMDKTLTATKYVKHEFSKDELLKISRDMAQADQRIQEIGIEMNIFTKNKKNEISEQGAIVSRCGNLIRTGYEMRPVDCVISYKGNEIIYTNPENNEVVEQRTMTQDEQLRLSGKAVDAEDIIREDSKRIVDEDTGEVEE